MRAAVLLIAALTCLGADYRLALPGYEYEFPRDHFDHPEFRTEWWYYTGNLRSPDGRRFGFELTFFRQGLGRNGEEPSVWSLDDVYLAHLALSDIGRGDFRHAERVNRAGPGLAGAREGRLWNGNWEVVWDEDSQSLQAVTEEFRLRLELDSRKPPVIHGENGVSQKAAGEGRASHYISLTRLAASGAIEVGGEEVEVSGTAWMDHEFFTHQLDPEQVGWDWMSIQLEDNSELMLFQLRRRDGTLDAFSAGTFVDEQGRARRLSSTEFRITPGNRKWKSYPIEWMISVPVLGLEIEATTPLADQELVGRSRLSPTYWEGAMDYEGTKGGQPIEGVGYLEMTGYEGRVSFGE